MIKRCILAIFTLLLLNSCASIFNAKTTKVKVYAPKESQVIFQNDTLNSGGDYIEINPLRSRDSLRFAVRTDAVTSEFAFKRKTSGIFYLNIPYTYGLGFLVDLTNQKRFTYRKTVNIKLDSLTNSFYVSEKKLVPFKPNDVFLYTSPLMAIDVFSQPMLTLGGEYFVTRDLSISAEAGIKYTERLRHSSDVELVKDRSHSFRVELKWYNLTSLTNNGNINEYLGLEARFLRHQFTDDINYSINNQDIFYERHEDYVVNKKVNVFNLKYGLNFPIGKRFYLDLYTGFGLRLKDFKNPNRFYDPSTHYNYEDDEHFIFWPRHDTLEENSGQTLFNFSLGFKFGIKL